MLERLVAMNLDSLGYSGLDVQTPFLVRIFLVRIAALVAIEAAPASYLVNLGPASDAGVSLEQAQGALIDIAQVVGSAKVAAAVGKILRAFGLAVALEESES